MHKLFTRQLAKATREDGQIDLEALARLVGAAYEDFERDRARADRSLRLMAEELETAHARLLDAFEMVPEGLVLLDAQRRYVLWNRRFAELYSIISDKIAVGASFAESVRANVERGFFVDAEGREEEWLADRLNRNGREEDAHEQHIIGDRWIRVQERLTADGGSIGIRTDITDLKRREESFRLMFENNPLPMWVIDLETHRFLSVNAAAVRHYGYTRDQFLTLTQLDLLTPDEAEVFLELRRAGRASQGHRVWRHLKADGSTIQTCVYGGSINFQGRSARLNAIVDVTNQQRAQELLMLQKLQTEAAVDNMSQGLLMFDSQARLVLCNTQYIEMYRISPGVVKPGCTLREVIEQRKAAGLFVGDEDEYCRNIIADAVHGRSSAKTIELADGRCIRVVNRPMADGGWVATHEDVTESKRADERIKYMAHHDLLTGLANRTLFLECIEEAGRRLQSHGEPFTILMLDLDRFKDANDSLGHAAGDMLLREVAQRLKSVLRKTDVVARLGGDEFAVLLAGAANDRQDSRGLAERIIQSLADPIDISGSRVLIDASIGIALAPADGTDPNELMKKADLALYRKKAEGRNGYRFFDIQMTTDADVRHQLAQDLRHAIANKELEIHYQPIIDVATRQPCGAEALVRWRHPSRGNIPPSQFIPLAEESGLIVQLGEWVLQKACTDAASWPSDMKVAINLSPAQFRMANLLDVMLCALVESGLASERLELEITESVLIENQTDTLRVVRQLKNLGVSIALDDFGTGYSSLSYLTMIPFDMIKIDKSFTQSMTKRGEFAAIVSSILTLGRGLDIAITAEGVETEEQFERLRHLGVELVQGFLFGKPCAVSQLGFAGERDGCATAVA